MKNNIIFRAIAAIWGYFVGMNSDPKGGVSSKRNMAWGYATLVVIVELYSLRDFPRDTIEEIQQFVKLCIAYVVIDTIFVCLALTITSVEKVTTLVKAFTGSNILKDKTTTKETTSEQVTEQVVTQTTDSNQQPNT
jgi:hypothetical protein